MPLAVAALRSLLLIPRRNNTAVMLYRQTYNMYCHNCSQCCCSDSGGGRTLVPWVRVTRVLPTLRVVNMAGALMSYLQKTEAFEFASSTSRSSSTCCHCRCCARRPACAAPAALGKPNPHAGSHHRCPPLPIGFYQQLLGCRLLPGLCQAVSKGAPVLLAEGVDTARQGTRSL